MSYKKILLTSWKESNLETMLMNKNNNLKRLYVPVNFW